MTASSPFSFPAPPRDPLAPNASLVFAIDMDQLRKMTGRELGDLRETLHCISNVVTGLMCQPRFESETNGYNAPGAALVRLGEYLDTYEQAVVNVAAAYEPATEADALDRAWAVLSFEADMRESLPAFSALAAGAVRDVAAAFRRGRSARSSLGA